MNEKNIEYFNFMEIVWPVYINLNFIENDVETAAKLFEFTVVRRAMIS